jgi:AcrR family transcriptional regulator
LRSRDKRRLGRPPDTDSDETRRRIIDAAQLSFGEQGYERATNKEIAERVGLTSGAIYHHFGSKAELYTVVCDHAATMMRERLDSAIVGKNGFVEKLVAVLDTATDLNKEQPSLAHFLVAAPIDARRQEELREAVGRCLGELTSFFTDLVTEAVANGEIAPEAGVESTVGLVQAMVLGLGQLATVSPFALHTQVIVECERLIAGTLIRPAAGGALSAARSSKTT